MSDLVTVRVTDLTWLFTEMEQLRSELKDFRESEENLKVYSIQQAAYLMNQNYITIRTLVVHGKLFAKYPNSDLSKCIIPLWAIKDYLRSKENSNQ